MAAICIQNPHTFNHAIQSINRDLLKAACQKHKTLDDRDQFVQAVFQSFLAIGGADIIKQLVAIKQNEKHDAWKDEECKRTLEQDWFLFINQILNFGRPTPAVNGVFTDVDQVIWHDDGESIEFTQSFDYFLYQEIMKCRGLPTMPTHHQGRGNAIKIRHDLANLIIQNFVQTTFANQINSLKDLVNLKDQLMEENLELKRSMAPEADPAPKRPKVAPQAAPQAAPNGGDSAALGEDPEAFEEAVAEAAQDAPKAQESFGEAEPEAALEEAEPEALEALEALESLEALEEAEPEALEALEEAEPEAEPEAALEEAEPEALESLEAALEEAEPEAALEEAEPEAALEEALEEAFAPDAKDAKDAKDANPWVEICDEHNTVMSNINPKQWDRKNKAKTMREFFKKHGGQPNNMGMSLVRAIRDSSVNVDSNFWDEPLFSDVNDEEPDTKTFNEIMDTFCNIIKNNWEKIQGALAK